jgi:protein-tyrosine sulfotransferase
MQVFQALKHGLQAFARCPPIDNFGGDHVSESSHIILGGCGRSGTTLARIILDSHPEVCCGPESDLLGGESIKAGGLFKKFGFDVHLASSALEPYKSRAEFIDRFALVCRKITGKKVWAEKTPRNVLNLPWIFKHFPKSRFVHLLRDGRDVACSLRTHPRHRVENGVLVPVKTNRPMKECALRWRDCLMAAKPYFSDPRFYTVRYEDLVSRPESTIAALADFLQLPWDGSMLHHTMAASIFRDPTKFPQNPEALLPIGTSATGRWSRDMAEEDRLVFKEIAGDLLAETGYAKDLNW